MHAGLNPSRNLDRSCLCNLFVSSSVKLESLNLQIFADGWKNIIGMTHLGIGDVSLLEDSQAFIDGARYIQLGKDQLFFLIHQGHFLFFWHIVQPRSQMKNGFLFLFHRNEEVRMHVAGQPF